MPPVRVVLRAKEKEHHNAEAQLTAERADAALVAKLVEEDPQLLADNRPFFDYVEHERKIEHERSEIARLKSEREEMFDELDELSDKDEEMSVSM